MQGSRLLAVTAILLALLVISTSLDVIDGVPAIADQKGRVEDETQIRETSRKYVDALNRGDVKAISSHWTKEGLFIDGSGQTFAAQEVAQQEFSNGSPVENRNHVTKKSSSIHWITANVALEQGSTTLISSQGGETISTDFMVIWVKRDGGWLLDYLRESSSQTISGSSKLDELSWMIGEWSSLGEGPVAQLTVRWSEGRKYILQDFTVQRTGQINLSGSQRIAWDPDAEQIRSWVFRADGGFVEGRWSHEGEAWVVEAQGVLPDGTKTNSVNLWFPEGPDRCWFKSLHTPADGTENDDLILEFTRTLETQ